METFFTSDLHLNHQNILKYCPNRLDTMGYSSKIHEEHTFRVEEMNELIISRWNDMIFPTDCVYCLGDMIFGKSNKFDLLGRLNGKKRLIIGNHDVQHLNHHEFRKHFESIEWYEELKITKTTLITLLHYPMESWNKMRFGSIHLHGHCHGTLKTIIPRRIDVGVDCNELTPFSIDHVMDLVKNFD